MGIENRALPLHSEADRISWLHSPEECEGLQTEAGYRYVNSIWSLNRLGCVHFDLALLTVGVAERFVSCRRKAALGLHSHWRFIEGGNACLRPDTP
jgi:hypothetical protein